LGQEVRKIIFKTIKTFTMKKLTSIEIQTLNGGGLTLN